MKTKKGEIKIENATEKTEKENIEAELICKKKNLSENEARLNGTYSDTLKRDYTSCDEEIDLNEKIVRLREIETEKNDCVNPKYEFEIDPEYKELKKLFALKELSEAKKNIIKLKQNKKKLIEDTNKLKEEVKILEEKYNGITKNL